MSLFKEKLSSAELAYAVGEEFINAPIPSYEGYLQLDNALTKDEYTTFSGKILLYRFFLAYAYLCDLCYIMKKASRNCIGGVFRGFNIAIRKNLPEDDADAFLRAFSDFIEHYHGKYLESIDEAGFRKDGFLLHGCLYISSFYHLADFNAIDKMATYTAMINQIKRYVKALLDDALRRFKIVE